MNKSDYKIRINKIKATFFGKFFEIPLLLLVRFVEKFLIKNIRYYLFKKTNKIWGGKVIPLRESISSEVEIKPSQEIFELVKRAEVVGVVDCFCRSYIYHDKSCKAPVHTCIILSEAKHIDEINKLGFNMKISKDEIYKILKIAEKWGLVHQLIHFPNKDFFYVICNCCPCCCAVLNTYKLFGEDTYIIKPSEFIVSIDENKCSNCGICLNYCYFNAIKIDNNNRIITDLNRCKGCGLCVSHCPNNARILILRNS